MPRLRHIQGNLYHSKQHSWPFDCLQYSLESVSKLAVLNKQYCLAVPKFNAMIFLRCWTKAQCQKTFGCRFQVWNYALSALEPTESVWPNCFQMKDQNEETEILFKNEWMEAKMQSNFWSVLTELKTFWCITYWKLEIVSYLLDKLIRIPEEARERLDILL